MFFDFAALIIQRSHSCSLILAAINENAEIYMQCIEQAGQMYGLQLNWNKLEALPVRCEARVKTPNGDPMVSKESLVYFEKFFV